MVNRILEHMNANHSDVLQLYVRYFNNIENISHTELIDINEEEMTILVNGSEEVKVKLTQKTELKDMQDELVKMAKIARENLGVPTIKEQDYLGNLEKEIDDFILSFKSVILSTLTEDNFPSISYAPFIKYLDNNYIFISEAAEHYHNLKNNGKLEVLFLEDESKAKSISLRRRVKFKSTIEFVERNELAEKILDEMEKRDNVVKMTRTIKDFHLIKINFITGRYVKGAGKSFDIVEDKSIKAITDFPHRMK